jgi:hypothetical protein
MSAKVIQAWQKKLDFLVVEQANASDPAVKFQLSQDIDSAEKKLRKLRAAARGAGTSGSAKTSGTADSVFLSYNHADATTAAAIRTALEAKGVPVRIDAKDMSPGQPIRDFILKSVGSTGATVCIVSRRSLLSGWVTLESLLALTVADLWGKRRFIACYVDDDFLDLGFSVKATDIIDRKIGEIDKLIAKHRAKRIDTTELNDEKSRLFSVRNGLGAVLAKLRGGLCLDVRPRKRAASADKLVATLQPAKAQPRNA